MKNEAESFESAAVAAAREQMLTACNVPASAAPVLGAQTLAFPSSSGPSAFVAAFKAYANEGIFVFDAKFMAYHITFYKTTTTQYKTTTTTTRSHAGHAHT